MQLPVSAWSFNLVLIRFIVLEILRFLYFAVLAGVAAMLYVSRKCLDVLLTVIKWSCLIAVAPAWLRPSPKKRVCTELTPRLLPLAQGRCLRPESSVCFGTAPLEFSVLVVEFSIYQLGVIYSAAVFAVWFWSVCLNVVMDSSYERAWCVYTEMEQLGTATD